MNKGIKKTIIMMGGLLLFTSVNAASIEVSSTDTNSSSVEVSLKDSDLNLYNKIEFELSLSGINNANIEGTKLTTFVPETSLGWSFEKRGVNKYTFTSTSGLQEGKIGIANFDAGESLNGNFKITPVNVKFYKTSGDATDAANIKEGTVKYISVASAEAYLTSLDVNQGTLSPEFDKNILEYEVKVPEEVSVIKITAQPNAGAVRDGSGNKALQIGENNFDITVTAADKKTVKTYKIRVIRGEINEPSAFIKELKIKDEKCKISPEFTSKNNKYTVTAPNGTTSIELEYTLEDKEAKVEIEGNKDFKVGENKVLIKVEASDESSKQEYELTVNVEEEKIVAPTIGENTTAPKKKISKKIIILLIAMVIVLIISIVSIVLFRKKKTNKNNVIEAKKEEDNKPTYDEQKTTTYNLDDFKEVEPIVKDEEEDLDKTKEFYF